MGLFFGLFESAFHCELELFKPLVYFSDFFQNTDLKIRNSANSFVVCKFQVRGKSWPHGARVYTV